MHQQNDEYLLDENHTKILPKSIFPDVNTLSPLEFKYSTLVRTMVIPFPQTPFHFPTVELVDVYTPFKPTILLLKLHLVI